jgi:hypothetical protein
MFSPDDDDDRNFVDLPNVHTFHEKNACAVN